MVNGLNGALKMHLLGLRVPGKKRQSNDRTVCSFSFDGEKGV